MWHKLEQYKTKLFVSLLLIQIIILVCMIFTNYLPLLWGKKITVKVIPVDPRSLFQGDYVRLQYPFNTLDLNEIKHDLSTTDLNGQETIYLVFAKKGNTYEPDFLTMDPQKINNKTYLKGESFYLTYPALSKEEYFDTALPTPSLLQVKWGIEQYYVPEGKGKELEAKIREGVVYANLAIYRGQGRVIDLITTTSKEHE